MNKDLEDILTALKNNELGIPHIYQALSVDEETWNNSATIRIVGGGNRFYLDALQNYALEKAKEEYPEFFEENEDDENE